MAAGRSDVTRPMQRRGFIKGAASLAGLAGLGGVSGCATVGGAGALRTPTGKGSGEALLGALLERERIVAGASMPALAGTSIGGVRADRVVKNGLQAMLWSHSLGDVEDREQLPCELQRPLEERASGMSRSVFTATRYLESLSTEELSRAQDVLRATPEMGHWVHDEIVQQGLDQSMDVGSMRHFTQVHDHVVWRLTHQQPKLFVEPLIQKVDRLATARDVDRRSHVLRADAENAGSGGLAAYATEAPSSEDAGCGLAPELEIGLILLGIGTVSTAGFTLALVSGGGWPMAFGITFGVIVFIASWVFIGIGASETEGWGR